MRLLRRLTAVAWCLAAGCASVPRPTVVIDKGIEDHPYQIASGDRAEYQRQIQPAIDEARRTYPAARSKFLAGLPEGSHFFLTVRLLDSAGDSEQLFVLVDAIRHGTVYGRIWSQVQFVHGYEQGQTIEIAEADLMDWTILDAAGAEEGNFVGKLIDRLENVTH